MVNVIGVAEQILLQTISILQCACQINKSECYSSDLVISNGSMRSHNAECREFIYLMIIVHSAVRC